MLRESKIPQNSHQLWPDQVLIHHETFAQQFVVGIRPGGQGPCQQRGSLFSLGSTKEIPHLRLSCREEKLNPTMRGKIEMCLLREKEDVKL